MLIGYASIFSAVIAWRASLASIEESRYESLAVQLQARRNQLERLSEGTVGQDERFVVVFQEHSRLARELQAQAAEVRPTDPLAADALDLEAQAHLALARGMQPFFLGAGGITLGEDGVVGYDRSFVLRNLQEGNSELREVRLSEPRTLAAVQRAGEKVIRLVGVGALIVSALFLLTIAQVTKSQEKVRLIAFAVGGVLVVIGTISFLFVEVLG